MEKSRMIDGPSVQADSAAPARARVDSTRNSHHLNFDSPPILLKDNDKEIDVKVTLGSRHISKY